jgi:hypothetical protein
MSPLAGNFDVAVAAKHGYIAAPGRDHDRGFEC